MGVVGEPPGTEWDGHVLLLHRTEDERLAGLTAWVRRGLDRHEKVICTEAPPRPADSLFTVLEERGVDVAPAVRDGQLAVLPVEEFYPPEGQLAVVERALVEGFAAVRMSSPALAGLSVLSPAVHRDVEERMAELVLTRPVHALCHYEQAITTGSWLEHAVATHLFGVHQSSLTTSRDLDGLALHGEVDGANADVFAAVLTAASRSTPRVLWLDLAEVAYLDAGSCWRLEDATRSFRAAGGHVLLVAPPSPVELIMRLMEVDELPGMHLVGAPR